MRSGVHATRVNVVESVYYREMGFHDYWSGLHGGSTEIFLKFKKI